MQGIEEDIVREPDISALCSKRWANEAETEIWRIDGSQCNQTVWGRAFHQENVRPTDTVESDWASLTRKAELEAPKDADSQISFKTGGELYCFLLLRKDLHHDPQGWVEGAVHIDTHSSKTTQSRGGRWKWSLWLSPDQDGQFISIQRNWYWYELPQP